MDNLTTFSIKKTTTDHSDESCSLNEHTYESYTDENFSDTEIDENSQSTMSNLGTIRTKHMDQKKAKLIDDSRTFRDSNSAISESNHSPNDVEISNELFSGKIREYVKKHAIRREIHEKFQAFLRTYKLEGKKVYIYRLNEMARMGVKSLEVDYRQMSEIIPNICMWLADAPTKIIEILNKSACSLFEELYPDNFLKKKSMYVRITNIPVCDSLRNIRQVQLNSLIRVSGVVVQLTSVYPQLLVATYNCDKCNYRTSPLVQNNFETEPKPYSCTNCQSKGSFTLNEEETIYRNYQRLKLQEIPSSVQGGRIPRSKEVILLDDLINSTYPGEEIEVTGIYLNVVDKSKNIDRGFPVFDTVIEANHIQKSDLRNSQQLITHEDHHEILNLSKQPQLLKLISNSIAPFIYNHDYVKNALALALFGGHEKIRGKHRLRGDINILLLGDPGTAKSQFLKYIEKTADKAVYTTGKGATAVGLTASVHKDPLTQEWALQGGALVIADKGLCLIDEFDKMNDQDRVSIHEAMEQQSISISKAGIVTQLKARCTVIAAANPINGHYDSSRSLQENVNLTDPILSRFDLLCIIKDKNDIENDSRLAEFVVDSHARHHSTSEFKNEKPSLYGIIKNDLLRKYIRYAKNQISPRLLKSDDEKIAKAYVELRRVSVSNASIPISVRHLESIIRIAEAHARIYLREYISSEDVDVAIKMMTKSYISAQKNREQSILEKNFDYFIDYELNSFDKCLSCLRRVVKNKLKLDALADVRDDDFQEKLVRISFIEFVSMMKEIDICVGKNFFDDPRFIEAGFSVSDDRTTILYQR